ncbi:hypothetical protein CHUAL_008440 [Chamberlinius hualienensis]
MTRDEMRSRKNSNWPKYVTIGVLVAISFVAGSMSMNFILNSKSDSLNRQRRSVADTSGIAAGAEAGASIKLVGQKNAVLTETKGAGSRLVNKWKIEDTFLISSIFELTGDHDKVTVKVPGVYLIYSQLSWTSGGKAAFNYEIRVDNNKLKAVSRSDKVLATCNDYKAVKGMKWKQCFTSVTAYLQSEDSIGIYVKKENFTIEFAPGKTFFGLTLLYSDRI